MGFSLLHLDRLRQRHEANQASTKRQWQSSSFGPGFQHIQEDWTTRFTRNYSYHDKLGDMSVGTVRDWQDV